MSFRSTTAALPALLLAVTVAAPAAAQAQPKKPAAPKDAPMGPSGPPVWHADSVTESPAGLSFTSYWSKGRSLRSYTVIQGRPVLTLVHGEWYYTIDELGGKGVAVQRSPRALQEDAKVERPFANEAEFVISRGGEVIKTESNGPIKINVWRLSDGSARREVWVPAEGERVPLQVVTFDRQLGAERRVRYISWARDIELPDRFFEPDPRIEFERLTYQEYMDRSAEGGQVTPIPILFSELLHGTRPEGFTP
jgi:hypothetical protein